MAFRLAEGKYFGDSLSSVENELFQCNISRYAPGQIIPKHYHENNYLSLLISGTYTEKNNSGKELLQAGTIIFRPAGYDHENDFRNTGGRCLNIELKQNYRSEMDFNFSLPAVTTIYPAGSFPSVYRLLRHFTLNAGDELCSEQIVNCFLELNNTFSVSSSLPWVEKVKTILTEESDVHHTLQSVAARVFVHPAYLAAAFKKKTGFTIGEFQLQAKLKKSLTFLFRTSMPVHEIAARTGFYDAAHFVRSFKLIYNVSPHRFRVALNA